MITENNETQFYCYSTIIFTIRDNNFKSDEIKKYTVAPKINFSV